MAAQLRPNRMAVTDRQPMLSFTIRAGNVPRVGEIVLAINPLLFTQKEGRTPATFYNSREQGLLSIPSGEAVFMLPPAALARFVGADRLWFGLATASAPTANDWTVDVQPNGNSPYVSLAGLSDRALRRVRMFPSGNGAGSKGPLLVWAGDRAQPGTTAVPLPAAPPAASPQPATNVAPQPATPPNDVHYDDGFGPLPPLQSAPPAAPAAGPTPAPAPTAPVAPMAPIPAPVAQGMSGDAGYRTAEQRRSFTGAPPILGVSRAATRRIATSSSPAWAHSLSSDPEAYDIDQPPNSDDGSFAEAPAIASALALGARENSLVTRTEASPYFDEGRSGKTIDRIIIHITDGRTVQSTVNHFLNNPKKVSAHYLIGQNGEVVQFVSEADTARHCAGWNQRSIGIEHVAVKVGGADYLNGHVDALPPTELQYETSAALVASLCDKYQLPINRTTIIGHREANTSTGHKDCPDGNWDWDYYMRLVSSRTCQPQDTSQSLCHALRGFAARGLADEIPLDPGVGGLSIGTDALEIGDIILTTTDSARSGIIRAGSGAEVSHAMLYVGQGGQVIEAIPGGVQLRPLTEALADARLAVAFRLPGLDETQKLQVAEAAARYLDRGFNYVGLIRCGGYLIDRRACDVLSGDAAERCRRFVGRIELGDGTDNENFFCSQLVTQAFKDIGKPIISVPPHWVPPGDLANLSTGTMPPGTLAYVGHLKATIPSRAFFGTSLALSAAQGVAPALDAGDWTINWDQVQMTPQPTDMGCWATAAAMVIGWRDDQSVDPRLLARFAGYEPQVENGLTAAVKRTFAEQVGLVVEPNACYTPDGFREILEANGPIWVTARVSQPVSYYHAVVATGMYRQDGQYFVRITDPQDRVVGTPGRPGTRTLPLTHTTGSRYIMSWDDFASEFEAAGDVDRIQLLHSGGTFGHTINRGSAAGAGYALGSEPAAAGGEFGNGVSLTRRTENRGNRSYDLGQLAGLVQPANTLASGSGQPRMTGQRITLDDWPYIDGPSGRTSAPVTIDWAWQGGAVGDVAIAPGQGEVLDDWSAQVCADIGRAAGTPERASLKLRITTTFRHPGEEDQVAVTEVVLNGDGRFQTTHGADSPPPSSVGSAQPAERQLQPA